MVSGLLRVRGAKLAVAFSLALSLSASALLLGSCSETLPRELTPSPPPAVAPSWGLDARPVSPTCRALPKPEAQAAPDAKIAYESLSLAKLENLVDIAVQGGRTYVVDRRGVIRYLASDGATAPVVLDLSAQLSFGYDSGLLSVAFHPKFAQNGYVYLAYTVPYPVQPPPPNVVFTSVVGRFQSKDGGLTIDPTTEKRLLVRDQQTPNHNGNKVIFGPDGYLYFAVGDGGVFFNPLPNLAGDPNALYGKILRIDVDTGDPYGIPPSNPFAQGGGAPEVYAYGFRNPWRISIDDNGDVWAGDVGANSWEEIDRVVPGGNYGWPTREGRSCYLAATCNLSGLIEPLVVHPHTEATAIIGGFVYRGSALPSLVGKYVYADNTFGTIWSVDPNAAAPVPVRLNTGLPGVAPTSFGVDEKGELVFVTTNRAYRIVAPTVVTETPSLLSATGCVETAHPDKPAAGLFAYDVNVPQWMDGATGERFLSLPADAPVVVQPGGHLDVPVGSVAMRTLRREGKLVETQMLLRRPDGTWSAYTYAWNADQRDAVLATSDSTIMLPSGATHGIAPAACLGCHDAHGQVALGLEAGQLDREGVDYGGGRRGNPLATLEHLGMLSAPVPPESYAHLPSPTGYDTPERRARAYLHGNCAFCHDGLDSKRLDLRFTTAFAETQICNVPGALPSGGTVRLAPGDPEMSQLVTSVRTVGPGRMPPSGATTPDLAAADLLATWIRSVGSCP